MSSTHTSTDSYVVCRLICWVWISTATVLLGADPQEKAKTPPPPPPDAATVIARLDASIKSVKTATCKSRFYRKEVVKKGGKLTPGGETINAEYEWGWDAVTDKRFVKGMEIVNHPDGTEYGYREFWGAFDGLKLWTLCEPIKSGQLVPYENQLTAYHAVAQLIGSGYDRPTPYNIANMLEGGEIVNHKETDGTILVRSPKQDRYQYLLAWLDPEKGYLTKKFEFWRTQDDLLLHRQETLKFAKTPDNLWVPVLGKTTRYCPRMNLPPGYKSVKEVAALPVAEWNKLKITYYGELMEEPTFVEIDPASLQVNQPIPPEKFTIDFPVGSVIYDGFLDKPFRVTDRGNEYFDCRKKKPDAKNSP